MIYKPARIPTIEAITTNLWASTHRRKSHFRQWNHEPDLKLLPMTARAPCWGQDGFSSFGIMLRNERKNYKKSELVLSSVYRVIFVEVFLVSVVVFT